MHKISMVLAGLAVTLSLASCSKHQEQASTTVADTSRHVTVIPAPHVVPYPAAKLQIVEPREGQVLKNPNDSVRIVMEVSGTALGVHTDSDSTLGVAYTKEGQHIHVIVDDKPYMADFRNGQPFNVGVLSPGVHTIRAFPSFSWHESIKSPAAFATRTFYVGEAPKGTVTNTTNLNGPLLTYSRPKGTYSGSDTSKVLLDFYISNATIDTNAYRVKLWIDGTAMPDIIKWQPYYIEGLSHGNHTVKLELIGPNGSVVPGPYNSPSEQIALQ